MNAVSVIRRCQRCGSAYDWRRSTSRFLRMTYCNSLCEAADLGGTIDSLMAVTRVEHRPPEASGRETMSSTALDALWAVRTCPRCDGGMQIESDGARTCGNCGARIVTDEPDPTSAQPTFNAVRYSGYS